MKSLISAAVQRLTQKLIASTGAAIVGWIQAGAGAIFRLLQDKLRESASAADFGAKGDNVQDDTTYQQAAINYVESTYDPATYASASPANGPSRLLYNSGYYKTAGTLTVTKKIGFSGDSPAEFSSGARVVQNSPTVDLFQIAPIAQGMSVSFENMALIGNGTGAGTLIHITKTTAACNSQRYSNLVFGTPPTYGLKIDAGDDIMINNLLVDVAALSAIALGTTTAANEVTNVQVASTKFFAVNGVCLELYNVDGVQIANPSVYHSGGAQRTAKFIDGYNTLPYQLKNISINGGDIKSVDCLAVLSAVAGFKINGLNGTLLGAGAGATVSGIELHGICSDVSITNNNFSGTFDTKHFYDDSGGTVTQANITGNVFVNTGGAGQALVCGNTSGVIANNTFIGFTTPSVSELVQTAGNSVAPGVIGAGLSVVVNFTVNGAKQGDKVKVTPVSTAWITPVGIEVVSYISAANTVAVEYRNVTAGAIGVPAHDIQYCVTRGA